MNGRIRRPRGALLGAAIAALVWSLLPGVALLAGQESGETSLVAEGAAVYGNMCGRCHNPRSPLERDDRSWVTIIQHMRVRGNLTGGQVRTVLAFLKATNGGPMRPTAIGAAGRVEPAGDPISTDPALVSLGELVLTQKACLGCHIVGGAGGNVGPSLNGVTGRRDPLFLRRKLIDPTFDNATSMMPNLGLTDEEIEAVLAFLATLHEEEEQEQAPFPNGAPYPGGW
ncbi:MAG: c-type cytochrome [Gemmatimonadota bacterium]